jgi:hypothetical protein
MIVTLDQLLRASLRERPVALHEIAPPEIAAGGAVLRRYPFPFRCALGILDDTRGASAAAFDDVRAAFAERALELGACASFDPADLLHVGGAQARALQEAGLLDGVAGLPGQGAAEGAAMLAQAGLRPRIFAGGAPIAAATALAAAGVRYFTDDGLSARTRFGTQYQIRNAVEARTALDQADYARFGLLERGRGDRSCSACRGAACRAAAVPAPRAVEQAAFRRLRSHSLPLLCRA